MAKSSKQTTIESTGVGCVLYVDGGCRPGYPTESKTKCGGWGIHGYTYNLNEPPSKLRTKKDIPTIKGYEIGDTVKLEEQVIPTGYIDAFGSMGKDDTSDRAELTGFKYAIDLIKEKGYKKAHFLLDNQYVINGVTGGYEKWSAAGWKKVDGSSYANREMWDTIMSDMGKLQNITDFSIQWVNGHSGNLGNDRADYLATKGVYYGRNNELNNISIKFSPIAKYRDPSPNINRLFTKSRWYFNTNYSGRLMSKDGRYVYHCGAHGPDDTLIGKPMADSVAYVVYTKEPMKVLDMVRDRHRELIPNPLNLLSVARLDTLLLPRIYQELEEDGFKVLSIAPRKYRFKGLVTIDGQEACKIIEPSGLTFKLVDVHNFMENELNRYLDGKCVLTEITDLLYNVEIDKKKGEIITVKLTPQDKVLRPYVDVVIKGMPQKHQCALTVGIDLPPRELINAIKDRKPRVYITTWVLSEYAFRYAVVVDCGDDTMLWMGKDSSMQFVFPEEIKARAKSV